MMKDLQVSGFHVIPWRITNTGLNPLLLTINHIGPALAFRTETCIMAMIGIFVCQRGRFFVVYRYRYLVDIFYVDVIMTTPV